jgi:hypothetical protein
MQIFENKSCEVKILIGLHYTLDIFFSQYGNFTGYKKHDL